jgi:hypothetical protein
VDGRTVVVNGDKPAAGVGFALTNPYLRESRRDAGGVATLIAVTFELVTDANVANRFVSVDYADDQQVYARNGVQGAVAASTNPARFTFQAYRGQSEANTNADVFAPLLPVSFPAGHRLLVAIANVAAGDQLDKLRFVFVVTDADLPAPAA